jgi:hypothetical protein
MKLPVIVVSDDVDIFDTPSSAARYLEAVDVRGRNIRVYDGDGRPMNPVVKKRLMAEVVELEETHEQPEVDELRQALIRFLEAVKKPEEPSLASLSLQRLLELARPLHNR